MPERRECVPTGTLTMQYMLATFNLRPGVSVEAFNRGLLEFERRMRALDLIHSVGPLAVRWPDALLDTDGRRQQFGFVTFFRAAEQSRRAIAYLSSGLHLPEATHEALHALIVDAVFSFWEDAPARPEPHDVRSG